MYKTSDLPFALGYNERGLLVGKTRSGKSELGRVLVSDKFNLIVTDPKHSFETAQDYLIAETLREVETAAQDKRVRKEGYAVIYRPNEAGCRPENINPLFEWVLARRNTFVYNTEVFAITRNALVYPEALKGIHTRGGGMNIGILEETQRPAGIPIFILSETDKFYRYMLQNPDDIDRMANYMGQGVREVKTFPAESIHGDFRHSFFYVDSRERMTPEWYQLDLTK